MKLSDIRWVKYIAPASVIAIILVVATLSLRLPAASAGPPPHDVPDFKGEPVYDTLFDTSEPVRGTIVVDDPQGEWITIFEADFENDENWEQQWSNYSQSSDAEDKHKYGTRLMENTLDPFSEKSAWAVGESPDGKPDLNIEDGYPANVNAWLIAGPFDFTNVAKVNLAFEYSFIADEGDTIAVQATADYPNFSGTEKNGGDQDWIPADMDLSIHAGEPSVYIAFTFKSDDSPNVSKKPGFLLDNVKLDVLDSIKAHLPIIIEEVPKVTPTPTITPGDNYYKGFTNNINPWEKVRWSAGADNELRHSDSCDGTNCGFLNLLVKNSDHYTIVSPKEPSKPYPYTIETEAKIRSPREDMDSYGIIFGASTNGQECPANDFSSCFEHYYELRIRYRVDGDSWMEYKLIAVGGHDQDNQAIETELIEWTKVSQNPDVFAEWDVQVEANGDIIIKVSDDEVGRTNDTKFINNPFFGFVVRSGPNGSSEVKFDHYDNQIIGC